MRYRIITDSTGDLTPELIRDLQLTVIPMEFTIDGKSYRNYPDGHEMSAKAFYHLLRAGKTSTTAQINAHEFMDWADPILQAGEDILYLAFSSGLSGTCQSAYMAKEELSARYPDRKIYVVDSLGASSGYGLLMDRLADLRDEGMSAEQIFEWAMEHRLNVHHWFFSTDLKFYIKGGRISKTAGFVGGMLGICPLLNMDDQGRLIPRAKIRSKRKVIQAIVDKMEENAEDGLNYSGKCYISQSACVEDAREVARLVEERFPKLNGRVEINYVGTTIGSHTGPGTVALFFWGKKREA